MSSSTEKEAANVTTCTAIDKEDDGSNEDTAAKRLTLQIEDLSIENDEEGDNTDSITTCAACDKEGDKDSMNICNKCKMVHYCNVACKKKHKSKHKKKCDRRVAELHDEDLFKEPPPPDDCPICMLPLPHDPCLAAFESCCGKLICNGCNHSMRETGGEIMKLCSFCKAPKARSTEEAVERIKKLMEKGNGYAFYMLAGCYDRGIEGLPQDWAKANELWLKAGELGCANAYYNLGSQYANGDGVEIDKKKAKHYWELAAMNGHIKARHNLGADEYEACNYQRAYKHFIISARAGFNLSLNNVKTGFMAGHVTKEEYASALRVYHERQTEMKSQARDAAADFQTRRR